MTQSTIGPTSWLRSVVFVLLIGALAAVPVRGCARSNTTLEDDSSAALVEPE
jgi:hypothetical protein